MAKVNTRIGWMCDEEYLIDKAGQCGTRDNKNFVKTTDGAAICVKYIYSDTNNVILLSTVEDYVTAAYNNVSTNVVTITATINDVTWYGTYYNNGANGWQTNYPEVTGTGAISSENASTVFNEIIVAAGYQVANLPTGDNVQDLPTIDYLKQLLTSVLTENNTRIFRQIDLMELLKYTEQTLTEQQQAQARQNLGITGGGVDYSTTEQDTGIKWVNGESVYQITYAFDPPASGGNVYIDLVDVSGLSIDTLIYMSGIERDTTYNNIATIETHTSNNEHLFLTADKSTIKYMSPLAMEFLTLRYTKTANSNG